MNLRWQFLTLCVATVAWTAIANAQSAPPRAAADEQRSRLLGALVNTTVTMTVNDMPAPKVFEALSKALEIPIVARFDKEGEAFGFDPSTTVSLTVEDRRALDVLEDVLEQCESYDSCTWQFRRGMVEVGTKTRLSVPAARESRTYFIRDLMIEAPRFGADRTPDLGKYGVAMLGSPAPLSGDHLGATRRKMPEELATEIVEGIVEIIEPGHWDYGQVDDQPDDTFKPGDASSPGAASGSPNDADTPPPSTPADQVRFKRWATIRLWRDQLIINAPDFIHRQIDGYPRAIGPQRHVRIVGPDTPPATQPQPEQGSSPASEVAGNSDHADGTAPN